MSKKEKVIKFIKSKGYDDDCTPNYIEEIADLVIKYNKLDKEALSIKEKTQKLCQLIVNSTPSTTIKGEIESLAFELELLIRSGS